MEAAEKVYINLLPAEGGGGGGTSDYTDLSNKPKINSNTLSGNKTGSQLGLVDDVQINGTSIKSSGVANIPIASTNDLGTIKARTEYGFKMTSSGNLSGLAKTAEQYSTMYDDCVIAKGTLENIKNTYVRSVSPACTTLTGTTATITANTTYAHAVSSSGCLYTLTTPASTDVYSGFILMLDTTNSASIAFQTDGSPATTIVINGNPTIATGKKYTVTGQYDVINNAWQLFIIDYSAS